jgi:hypothetical protein
MMPPPKFKVIRQAVASSLLVEKARNKLLTVSQFLDAFLARINLGGGIRLTETALKKSFTSREGGVKYHLSCCDKNVGHDGSCVLVVLVSFRLEYGSQRSMAFDIFNSLDCADKLDASHVMDDSSIGRLQLSLTDSLKADLAKFLEKNFSIRAPPVEQRCANPPRQETEKNQTESSASTSDDEATAPTLQEESLREMTESGAEESTLTSDEETAEAFALSQTKRWFCQRRSVLNWNPNMMRCMARCDCPRLILHSL